MENILEIDTSLSCQICNGELHLIGVLGNREHYMCRQCGMQWSYDLSLIKTNPFTTRLEN